MDRELYIAWQSRASRKWYTVGLLSYSSSEKRYTFRYLRGALDARDKDGFSGISAFPRFEQAYNSDSLFSFFANRIVSSERPDYPDLIAQVGLQPVGDARSPKYIFDFLGRTRGWRATDSFEMFSPVSRDAEGIYRWEFFTRGLRYIRKEIQKLWTEESPSMPLRMLPDPHNKFDPTAVHILDRQQSPLGFVPGNYSSTIYELVAQAEPQSIELKILRHNKAEELHQKRFLLEMRVKMPADFELTKPPELEPIVDIKQSVA